MKTENKNYWMHRITYEREVKEAILQKGPDCEEKEQLVKSNRRFVIPVVNQYQKCGLSSKN